MATYIRLTDYKSSDEKEQEFFNSENRYEAKQEDFSKIPASPIIYWFNEKFVDLFNGNLFNDVPIYTGMATSDNGRFLRFWQEVNNNNINFNAKSIDDTYDNTMKWFPYNKGGSKKKWYGNFDYLVNFSNDGEEIKAEVNRKYPYLKGNTGFYIRYQDQYFKEGLTWSAIASGLFTVRKHSENSIFSNAGFVAIPDTNLNYYIALLNSNIALYIIDGLAQTINLNAKDIGKLPIRQSNSEDINQQIETLTQQNIDISKEEWDSRETSWDFTKNELIKHKTDTKIETAYSSYCNYWSEKFVTLHKNEEELNRLFIDIYELQDELDEYVDFKDITILKNETEIQQILIPAHTIEEAEERAKTPDGYMYNSGAMLVFKADEIMKQFISYGVGVMFGRYSLDSDGLLIANMGQEVPNSTTFEIDDDNVIPVLEDDYFKDDIASRFVQFVKASFGEEDLSENIRFIESSLGTTLRKYFVKGFYEDHIKRYKKRPIYWMVASPKKGFMSLIYMHRYEADTFARVRNSYLTEYIAKLEAHKETLHLTTTSETASNKDKKDADKLSKSIEAKLKEVIAFDREKMMSASQNPTEIDLDDGVKVNYCRFREILYPITGLCK